MNIRIAVLVAGLAVSGCANYHEIHACYEQYPMHSVGMAAGAGLPGILVASALDPQPSNQDEINQNRKNCIKSVQAASPP